MGLRALAATLLLLAFPAAAHAADAPWVGVNDISGIAGLAPYDVAAGAAADMGATSTRIVVDWSWIEPSPGVYAWGVLDAVYRADLARGLRPLIGVTGAPRWAWARSARCAPAATCAYPPGRAHDADYAEMVRGLARRYPRAVAIEVGNEPNLSWAWAGGLSPARYTDLLKLAYGAVKSVAPDMPVISGGLAPVLDEARSADAIGLRRFLQAMYDHGAKGHMDGISIHPYPGSVSLSRSFAALSVVKDVRAANGDAVPLWVTEFGLSTPAVSEDDQGTTLPALYRALRADPDVRGVYVHTLYDDSANPVASERGYGLLRADRSPKPAYCGLAAANGASASCPVATAGAAQTERWQAQVLLQAAADAARRVHVATGSYDGLTAAALHAQDPRISARSAAGSVLPGAAADPAQIAIYPLERDGLVLCNASVAGRSYCFATRWATRWAYGSSNGTLFAAAGAVLKGASTGW